jgi:hypothetical protein
MDVTLRPATPGDAEACGAICYRAFKALVEGHGFAPDFASAEVAVGLLSGLLSHPGFLLPTRNAELFRWCLEHDRRVVQQDDAHESGHVPGAGQEPAGASLPLVLY